MRRRRPELPTSWDIPAAAAHAAAYAHDLYEARLPFESPTCDPEAGAASAVLSVAVAWVVPPMVDAFVSGATLHVVSELYERQCANGPGLARWLLGATTVSDAQRSVIAARFDAIADVIDAAGVDLRDCGLTTAAIRAYASTMRTGA